MGIIKATVKAVGSTLHDQWKDLIACENMDNDTLMVMKTTDTGAISKGNIIRVMPGQCIAIIRNGKVLDACAEPGDYNFDENAAPSFFTGDFGAVFKEMWTRFTFGGAVSNQYAVFYFNTKEIIDNKFGTAAPVSFQDWSHIIPNQMTGEMMPLSVEVKCFGTYTYKITDPSLFMTKLAGTATVFKRTDIEDQLRNEVVGVLQNLLNELGTSKYKVPVLELPSQSDELEELMHGQVFDKSLRDRGLTLMKIAISSVTLTDKSKEAIDNYQLSANANMRQGTMTGAYAQAVKDAANNANGAATGFMGVGMMNGMMGSAPGMGDNFDKKEINSQASSTNASSETWKCPNCGVENTGKFCSDCGTAKPGSKFCSKCGAKVSATAKFCPECGEKLQ